MELTQGGAIHVLGGGEERVTEIVRLPQETD